MPSNERPPFVVAATSCYAKKTKGQRGCSFRLWSRTSDTFYIRICLLWVYPMEYVRYGAACLSLCLAPFTNFPSNIPRYIYTYDTTLRCYLISLRCVWKIAIAGYHEFDRFTNIVSRDLRIIILIINPIYSPAQFRVNKNFSRYHRVYICFVRVHSYFPSELRLR